MRRVTIGNVEVLALQDAHILMDPRQLFPAQAEQFVREYGHEADERGLFPMSATCYVVRSAGASYLVDTGIGPRRRPGFPRGTLAERLAEAGLTPGDIDAVIHTHLHIDHVGWNTVEGEDGTVRPFFPRARFLIQRQEWEYWMAPERLNSPDHPHLAECVAPLQQLATIEFAEGEAAIDTNLTFVAAPGHTPAHVAIGIYSAGERAVIIGDASHHPVQLTHPDWSPVFDVDPITAAATRDRLFERAAADGSTWIAGHWPFPGIGTIARLDSRRVFRGG